MGTASVLLERIRRDGHSSSGVDIALVKSLIRDTGIPGDECSVRLVLWSLLLGVSPPHSSDWNRVRVSRNAEYQKFCSDFIIEPESSFIGDDADHPLNTDNNSSWKKYFEDKDMREQIDRDISRTQTDLVFFSGDYRGMKHRDKMSRALFIYYKLNPGIRYVQGMNEIYAVMYYVFGSGHGHDALDEMVGDPEVSAFFGFVDLMSEFRDSFCDTLDRSDVGIAGTMSRITSLIKTVNPALSAHLENTLQISPHLYAFRWVTALFTQEFVLPDVIILWDRMLSEDGSKMNFVVRVCAAMVLLEGDCLLKCDFASAMKMLQQYPSSDISKIIQYSDQFQR